MEGTLVVISASEVFAHSRCSPHSQRLALKVSKELLQSHRIAIYVLWSLEILSSLQHRFSPKHQEVLTPSSCSCRWSEYRDQGYGATAWNIGRLFVQNTQLATGNLQLWGKLLLLDINLVIHFAKRPPNVLALSPPTTWSICRSRWRKYGTFRRIPI